MKSKECPSCKEENNPSFSKCWKCGVSFNEDPSFYSPAPVKEPKIIIGFWKKYFADYLDVLILGAIGFVVSFPFRRILYLIGENGWWVGLVVNFLYIGILQTRIGKGQSLGKKILNIQVLRTDGSYMSLGRSLFRYSILALAFYNSAIFASFVAVFPVLYSHIFSYTFSYCIMFLVAGFLILVPLHPLKKGIHDVLADTIVVRFGSYDKDKLETLRNPRKVRFAYIATIAAAIIFIVGTTVFSKFTNSDITLESFTKIEREVSAKTKYRNVQVGLNTYRSSIPENNSVNLAMNGFLYKSDFDNEALVKENEEKAARILAASNLEPAKLTGISVRTRSGFDLGISRFSFNKDTFFDTKGNRKEEPKNNSGTIPNTPQDTQKMLPTVKVKIDT